MLVVWLFAFLLGVMGFAFANFVLGYGIFFSLLFGIAEMLLVRGLASWAKRYLILTERLPEEPSADKRTLETNRYIFWRRAGGLIVLLAGYFGVMYEFLGVGPGEAVVMLPSLILQGLVVVVQLGALLVANFALFFGPFLLFGRMGRQMLMPGDANYDVQIEDVRGQKSAINEMVRILKLMESGRNYVKAGGKRERGVLFVGPPGTGKTMLAKGIATSLQMPIIITSGSAFSGMFMGMDMVSVFMMVRAAKKKARRWGGCAIFIDEFDALGNRRAGMGGGGAGGAMGGMFGGGQLGLNTLLVLMDGVDNPGALKKNLRRFINLSLDGLFVPREIRINGSKLELRMRPMRPPRYNLFFMGATNRPDVLDEAVTRPGRFGRTITSARGSSLATPICTSPYFDKKAHDPELDTASRRDEVARITDGYSPAMIDQVLSLALMYAFEEGRSYFTWRDLRDAMGNVEAGLAEPIEYNERDKIAIARHELGHAVAARFFEPEKSSVRLSIRMRATSYGHHRNIENEEQFVTFRSQAAGDLRHTLGAIAAERVFYGENSSGVSMDLIQATRQACHMVGVWGMGPDPIDPALSRKAAGIGEHLISRFEDASAGGGLGGGTVTGAVLQGPSRRVVAQVMGAAYIDDWRLMHVNQEAIDQAAEALIAQGELMGDEVGALLDSVNLRNPTEADPYPDEQPLIPPAEPDRLRALETA
ncbi:MAG: AAA family ATPase [Chloroflexota bacterium]